MKVAIITASIRRGTTTPLVAEAVADVMKKQGWLVAQVGLESFCSMFTGDYITQENATREQAKVLCTMQQAEALLFVVPTYYKSMPGVLKNFYDSVKWPDAYDGKLIGFVASNHKNQDYGAGHAEATVKGLLTFFNISAVLVHEIAIINPNAIDFDEVERCSAVIGRYFRQYYA